MQSLSKFCIFKLIVFESFELKKALFIENKNKNSKENDENIVKPS